jgi:hypothetical protein
VVVSVVAIVITSVPDPEATEGEARVQVAGLVAPDGPVTAQARATAPLNVPSGVTVTVVVLAVVAPGATVRLALFVVSAKLEVPTAEPLTTA